MDGWLYEGVIIGDKSDDIYGLKYSLYRIK